MIRLLLRLFVCSRKGHRFPRVTDPPWVSMRMYRRHCVRCGKDWWECSGARLG